MSARRHLTGKGGIGSAGTAAGRMSCGPARRSSPAACRRRLYPRFAMKIRQPLGQRNGSLKTPVQIPIESLGDEFGHDARTLRRELETSTGAALRTRLRLCDGPATANGLRPAIAS